MRAVRQHATGGFGGQGETSVVAGVLRRDDTAGGHQHERRILGGFVTQARGRGRAAGHAAPRGRRIVQARRASVRVPDRVRIGRGSRT